MIFKLLTLLPFSKVSCIKFILHRAKKWLLYSCKKTFFTFASQIQFHRLVNPVNTLSLRPNQRLLINNTLHCPEFPSLLLLGKENQFLPNLFVFIVCLLFVIKHRTVYDKKLTRIPSAYSFFCSGINYQFPLLKMC